MINIKAQLHYSNEEIKKKNANFNLIYGEKSGGKSYQMKHNEMVCHFLETGKRFILLRRWKEDITNLWLDRYFNEDVDIKKLTKGKYNYITSYRKELYLSNIQENGKIVRGVKIGYAMSLSTEQHMSSASFLDVDSIVFEEFMERGAYIAHEADKLMIFYNTIDRGRGVVKLWLVGNTITRVNPYLRDWGLQEVVRKQKQGDIDVIEIHNENNTVRLAIEYAKSVNNKQMAIGNASNMIDKGAWQTNPQPHLPKSRKLYKKIFECGFLYKGFKFSAEFLQDNGNNTCWFIYPQTKDFKNDILIFSDVVKINPLWQTDIYNITKLRTDKIRKFFIDTFRECNIFYSDDLTGTDFKQAINFSVRR